MKIKAKELTDATVSHISLVDRGANREPFRIKKHAGDMEMLDFSKGLKDFFQKSEVRQPAIAVVAFAKGYDPKAALALLDSAGLKPIGDGAEDDTALVFKMETDFNPEHVLIYKLSDDVAVGVRYPEPETVKKGFQGYDYESTSYKDVLGTNTTMPMVSVATGALMDTVWNIMANSDTVEIAKKDIAKAVKDFGGVVGEIVDRVPASAFKLEDAVHKVVTAKAEDQTDTSGAEDGGEDEDGTKDEGEKKPEAGAADTDTSKGGEGKEPVKKEDDKSDVTTDPVMAAIKKMTDTMETGFASVKKTTDDLKTELGSVKKSVGDTQTALKKMDDELGTSVTGGDRADNRTSTQKADNEDGTDEDGYIVLDTAYGDLTDLNDEKAA
jgi:hypothetical protein